MNRYEEMRVFVRAADDGSFSAASRNLDLTPSAVSKLVSRIEDRLGVLLFRRGQRAIELTPEGEAFLDAARTAIEAVDAADATVIGRTAKQEILRIRSMPIFGQLALAPRITEFSQLHPTMQIEIHLRIDPGNLLDDGMDVAINVGRPLDSSLVARRFCSTRWIICAAPSYLARYGAPSCPAELKDHNCLNFVSFIDASHWNVRDEHGHERLIPVKGTLRSNQASMLIQFARSGVGIVRLTEIQVADDLARGDLIELFPKYQSHEEDPIFAVHQSRRHVSKRVRALLDFLDDAFKGVPPWQHWRTA